MNVNKPFTILAASSLLAAPPLAGRADGPSLGLQEVLSRHLQALGRPQARKEADTERVTGTIQTGGLSGTYTTISKGHHRYWSEEKLGLSDEISGSDGKVTWVQDTNGSVRLTSTEELKNDRNSEYVDSASYAASQKQGSAVTLRPQREKRTGDYILDIAPEGGKAATLFLDPKTFLIAKEQHQDDDLLITTDYSDYKMLDGGMTAATRHISNGDHHYDIVSTITDDRTGVEAPDSLFAMPPLPKNYQWVHPDATSATIAFDANDEAIKLFIGINGRPAFIILDSGASTMALGKYAVDKLHIPHIGTMEARGYGGSTNIYPVKIDTFELPDSLIFKGITATSIDLPAEFGFGDAVPTVGFVGYTLLSRFVVQIDYASQEVTLRDPDSWKPSAADGQAIPMELDDNVPSIQARFDGLPAGRFLVDTGDSGCVRLYTPFVAQNKLSAKYPKGMDSYGMGVGGVSKSRQVRAASFDVAGLELKGVPTDLALDEKAGSSHTLAGALGHEFLSHFTVTFDYPHQRIFFAPNPETQKPFDTRTSGVYLLDMADDFVKNKRRIVVLYVDPKSPAFDAGLNRGDIITEIDGQPTDTLGLAESRRLLSPAGGKDAHELSVIGGQGGTGKIKVALYDPLPSR